MFDDSKLFSRPTTSGWGKCTETLKCLVPDEEKAAFVSKSRALGYGSESDCLRELVMVFLHGHEAMAKVHAERLRLLAGIGQEPVR